MNRSLRAEQAKQTVQIVEEGSYQAPSGRVVAMADLIRACVGGTQYFSPQRLAQLRQDVLNQPAAGLATSCEVRSETTLAGISRLADGTAPVAALNFASARNPGGGFLGGSQAQEESLARSSALYASLISPGAGEYYDQHRAGKSLLYSDATILSPDCPVFRDDAGTLLDQPQLVAFITCAAPNAGATANNRPEELDQIPAVFQRRAENVLAVAAAFATHLRGDWAGRFECVRFSVLDTSPGQATLAAFQRELG